MANDKKKVKLSQDGSSIDYTIADNAPTNLKKFRASPEIEGFYRFVYENDLQRDTFKVLDRLKRERYANKKTKGKKK